MIELAPQIDSFAQFETNARKNYVTHKTSNLDGRQGSIRKPIGSKSDNQGTHILFNIKSE